MRKAFWQYIIDFFEVVPNTVLAGLAIILCFGVAVTMSTHGLKKGAKIISRLVLFEYVLIIFFSTVFTRSYYDKQGYNFHPFWSYEEMLTGQSVIPSPDKVMNVLVFIPVGLLLACGFRRMKWWKAMLVGAGISVAIELLQFIYKCGFSEVDDVFHNVLGCLIGFGVYKLVECLNNRIKRKNLLGV